MQQPKPVADPASLAAQLHLNPLACRGSARPRLFMTAEPVPGLRSLAQVRADIQTGHARVLWRQLLDKVEQEAEQPAWTPQSELALRNPRDIKHANREYILVALTCFRIIDASLVALIRSDCQFADAAMRQIEAVFDDAQWPEIEDLTHLKHNDRCSLRRGQLAFALGLAYDWLHNLLTQRQRAWFVEQFNRRFTQAFAAALEAKTRITRMNNNFVAAIYGGFAVAAMALGEDDPHNDWLIQRTVARMEQYVGGLFGPDGEFSETVQYAGGATAMVGYYLLAQQYASLGRSRPFTRHNFDAFNQWYMHFTFPPGHVAGFGDPAAELPPMVSHISGMAAALRDPVLQWYYLQYAERMLPIQRIVALEVVGFDAALEPTSPADRLPLGRAYHHIGKLVSSRSSWDPDATTSAVYAKAGVEHSHGHPDWGQVCIDGYGQRLIVDLGSAPGYPPLTKDQWFNYYNFHPSGHNILVFGNDEKGDMTWKRMHHPPGRIVWDQFDDARGGAWCMDLTDAYEGQASRVRRTVVHLLPRVVVVLDEAGLKEPMPISLRWHTIAPPQLDKVGQFTVATDNASLVGLVTCIDGSAAVRTGNHAYHPPYNVDRLGEIYPQRHEPFVEVTMTSDRCRVLSLFCVLGPGDGQHLWRQTDQGWSIQTPEGEATVSVDDKRLTARIDELDRGWTVEI